MKIFIAVYPDPQGNLPQYFSDIEKKYLVLHPSYNFSTEEGLKALNEIKPVELPPSKSGNNWNNALEGDCYTLSMSDVLIFDVDSNPGNHFLAWAKAFKKPVICVSQNLTSVEPYYSGSVRFVCKPQDIFNQLTVVSNTVPEDDISIFSNEWMQLRKKFGWYTYARHRYTEGVAVLGYDSSNNKILIRKEHCPCHVTEKGELYQTSITGSVENGDPRLTALAEMQEEAGAEIKDAEELKFLGTVYPSKFLDYKQHLFAVDLKGYTLSTPEGDGSEGEKGAFVEWVDVSKENLFNVSENTIGNSILRLRLKYGVDLLNDPVN